MGNNYILGISAFYHDSAAVLLQNGHIIAAAQEERFTRKKHDANFPEKAITYCLSEVDLCISDIKTIVFYDKPFLKFERLLETYLRFIPFGLFNFIASVPVWIKEKLFLSRLLKTELKKLGNFSGKIYYSEHHLSHAASAFYPSNFKDAAILTIDGVGEWTTTMIAHGKDTAIIPLKQISFPHSLGLLYSAFTYYCGFKVNSGEYKLMGLAPYGAANSEQVKKFKKDILTHLIDVKPDGSFLLNMSFFKFNTGLRMTNDTKWKNLFGIARRKNEETPLTQDYMNLALAIQIITEDIVIRLAKTAKKLTNSPNLVLAGGVALNCVANGKLLKEKIVEKIWIQPASGDAGGALGAAQAFWHIALGKERIYYENQVDLMSNAYLGPSFSLKKITNTLNYFNAKYTPFNNLEALYKVIAAHLDNGKVVGWFQGRMEFGPRALCHRSIIGDPRKPDMQKKINLKIKYREGFRPFAPVVQAEDCKKYFDIDTDSKYMLLVAPVQKNRRNPEPKNYENFPLKERLYHLRSDLPAITHVDYSARIQTITEAENKPFYSLLDAFKKLTGTSVLINTSFNVRGEPIVCSPGDAYHCFMHTEMDVLVMENIVCIKEEQPSYSGTSRNFEKD